MKKEITIDDMIHAQQFHLQTLQVFGAKNIKQLCEITTGDDDPYTHQKLSFEVLELMGDQGYTSDEKMLAGQMFSDLLNEILKS